MKIMAFTESNILKFGPLLINNLPCNSYFHFNLIFSKFLSL